MLLFGPRVDVLFTEERMTSLMGRLMGINGRLVSDFLYSSCWIRVKLSQSKISANL